MPMLPAELAKLIADVTEKRGKVIRKVNIKLERAPPAARQLSTDSAGQLSRPPGCG